jgi:hypothetical protein
MAGKTRFSPVVAALRLSPDSAAGKNAVAMSIASQQVSCARVFDRFTNVIWRKSGHNVSRVSDTQEKSLQRMRKRIANPDNRLHRAIARQGAASAVVAVSGAAEVK